MPFPATRVIGPDWDLHHRPTAAGAMRARVTVGAKTGSTYDPGTDDTVAVYSSLYSGPARIVVQNQQSAQGDVAGQLLVGQGYLVQLDAGRARGAKLRSGMRCKVTACDGDELLAGRELWVVSIPLGSERFTRDLICSDNETDTPTG